jgi:uncharacterized membrane protein
MHIEVSLIVRAARDKAYTAYTDFESMPKWSKQLTTVRVAKREGDAVYLEVDGVSDGKQRRAARKLRLLPSNRIESESETRFTRSERIVTFDEDPEGTKVTAVLDVRVKGAWAKILTTRGSEDEVKSSALEELSAFARYVEGDFSTKNSDAANDTSSVIGDESGGTTTEV